MADIGRINNNQIPSVDPSKGNQKSQKQSGSDSGVSFGKALKDAQSKNVSFSNHAAKRLEKRDIVLSDQNITRLENAVTDADQKGGKDSLVLMDNLAFIVNVRDRIVVTALDVDKTDGNVFTQIDTVVVAKSEDES